MLDMEDDPVYGRVIVASDVEWSKEFLDSCHVSTTVKGLMYMNTGLKGRFNWSPVKDADYGLVDAQYGPNNGVTNTAPDPAPWAFWAVWQYTSVGHVSGANGNIDLDEFNGSADALKRYGLQGASAVTPQPVPNVSVTIAPTPVAPTLAATYNVQSGDTLSGIAAKYGTSWQSLAAANHLANPNLIYPGQVLLVPGAAPSHQTYAVVSGDNLSSIAAKFGTSWQRLAQINGLANANLIYPGQVLKVV
jgi:lysozyme